MISDLLHRLVLREQFEPGLYSFLNPYSYLLCRRTVHVFQQLDGIYIDGEYLAKFLRVLCAVPVSRASFDMTSLAPKVFTWCAQSDKRVALVGTTAEAITEAATRFQQAFPGLNLSYVRNGFFSSEDERQRCFAEIKLAGVEVVVVGMGTPLQEQFLIDLWDSGWRGVGFTCGGFFHQTASRLQYYPRWVDKLNVRWLYRIYDEPKLFKRYAIQYPKFVFVFLYDWLRWHRSKKAT